MMSGALINNSVHDKVNGILGNPTNRKLLLSSVILAFPEAQQSRVDIFISSNDTPVHNGTFDRRG